MCIDFDASQVTFRIVDNFGKRCLLAEYCMYASVAIDVKEGDTIGSLADKFDGMIQELNEYVIANALLSDKRC